MSVIKYLYEGRIGPADQCHPHGKKYKRLNRQILTTEKKLMTKLSPDAQKLFWKYENLSNVATNMEHQEMFANGFRLGINMLCESLFHRRY